MIPKGGFRPATEHNHHPPKGFVGGPAERAAAGRKRCPICSLHDHSITVPYGYDRDHQPIPGWWFTCPRCGDPEGAQLHIHKWTATGLNHMRHNDRQAAAGQ